MQAVPELVSTAMQSFLAPKSIAVIGASARSSWCSSVLHNLESRAFTGGLHLVNKSGARVGERTTFMSCRAIGEPVDLGILLVPESSLAEAIDDAGGAGIRSLAVLASGFAEAGQGGRMRQQEIVDRCRARGVTLLGPNCLGLFSLVDSAGVWTAALPELKVGGLAIVSQSGGIGHLCVDFAAKQKYGVSHVISTGNEAMVEISHVIAALVEDSRVRAIAVFCESIRSPATLLAAAARAAQLKKAIVMLKAGRSELAAQIARSHTDSLVGDDGVISASLASAGVLRVSSIEDLMITGALAAEVGKLEPGGLGLVSISGGACDLLADAAELEGVYIPQLAESAARELVTHLPSFATPRNPLDVTGASNKSGLFADVIAFMDAQPTIAMTGVLFDTPPPVKQAYLRDRFEDIGKGFHRCVKPGLHIRQALTSLSDADDEFLSSVGISLSIGGIAHSIRAIGKLMKWSRWLELPLTANPPVVKAPLNKRRWNETDALRLIASHGVPVVTWRIASSVDESIAAANAIGWPVVLKAISADLAHKSEVGGVRLNLQSETAVRDAFNQILAIGVQWPHIRIEGVMVCPMRPPALELLVGVTRDEEWGSALTVGIGGIFAEIVRDTITASLPLSARQVSSMLRTLKGAEIFRGARGGETVDLEALAAVVVRIGDLGFGLGDALSSLEINPLRVAGASIEALDALVIWNSEGGAD